MSINNGFPYLRLESTPSTFTGSGTEVDPYQIWTPVDLDNIRYESQFHHYILMANLDLNGYESWIPIISSGSQYDALVAFNGNNKSISNLKITSASITENTYALAGLFAVVTASVDYTYIKDLTMINPVIDIKDTDFSFLSFPIKAGVICSEFNGNKSPNSKLYNIKILGYTGSVINSPNASSGIRVAGISGDIRYCTMSLCIISSSQLFVSGNANVGDTYINGIANIIANTNVLSCSVSHTSLYLNTSGSLQYANGAFATVNSPGAIKYSSVSNCKVISIENGNYSCYIDGFVGDLYVSASNCYVLKTNITSSGEGSFVSGFADYRGAGGSLKNIYVSADYSASDATNIYYILSEAVTGLFTSYYESRSNVVNVQALATGLPQSQMQDSSSYIGFDFVNVWQISSSNYNYGYPYLSWQTVDYIPSVMTSSFTITYPNGGESYYYNQMVQISWIYHSGSL